MKRMDEMEKAINLLAIRYSWLFGILSLLAYNAYFYYKNEHLNIIFIIMLGMLMIYKISTLIEKYKKGDNEVVQYFMVAIAVFLVCLVIGFGFAIL
ncbi:hypothetical protein [Facklamia lactis]|uniref:hypothetical protein n=1 Tax=Facklamia lactis TaxID=2749967 RepID=UPI0018CFD9F7|nr:hypothetical protein [Facklamia lactis]MBG9979419.1 hypothetical protein [Facklamia lactis]